MTQELQGIGLKRSLAKRMGPLTLFIGIFISLGLPTIYYLLEQDALQRQVEIYARNLSDRFEEIVQESPTAWKYQTYKYSRVFADFLPGKDLTFIQILDKERQVLSQQQYGDGREKIGGPWYAKDIVGSAPILSDDRLVGTVLLGVSQGPIVSTTLTLLLLSTMVGIGLSTLIYLFPTRIVGGMERQIEGLLEELQRSNDALRESQTSLKQRVAELTALHAVATAISQSLDLEEVLKKALEAALAATQMEKGIIRLLDEQTGTLLLAASRGISSRYLEEAGPMKVGEGFSGHIVQTGEPLFVSDASQDSRLAKIVKLEGVRSIAGVPLIAGDWVLGTMSLNSLNPRSFGPEEAEMLASIGRQVGMAVANARLYQGHIRQNQELAALHAIASAVNQTLHLDELLQIALDKVQEVTGKRVVFIRTLDRQRNLLVLRGHRGLPPTYVEATPTIPLGMGGTGWVLQEKKSLYIPKVSADPRLDRWLRFMEGEWSYFCVPMMAKGEVIGTLSVASDRPDDFTPEEQRLIEAIAYPIGVAVENAHLYQELRDYSATLEERVEERTRALEEASRHKSQFLANMSHELRTPLNAIIGFSELLEDQNFGPLNEKQARYVHNIWTSGQHLLQLINDILDLSKVEVGKMELRYEEFSVKPVVEESLTLVAEVAKNKKIALTADVPEELTLTADPVRIKQVLHNLLSNAVKFTPTGGSVTVTARVQCPISEVQSHGQIDIGPRTLDAGTFVEISVQDTGIGIRPEDQQRIFFEFEQLDSSEAKAYQGTGLGLALVKKIVELHGGRIEVTSEVGKGSTFTVTIPRKPSVYKPVILVVDDEAEVLEALANFLEGAGYTVDRASDGEEALRKIHDRLPHLLVLDLYMPRMNGWQLLERLQTQSINTKIPILVLTGAETDAAAKTLSLGASEFLTKPFSPGVLLSVVERLIGKGHV